MKQILEIDPKENVYAELSSCFVLASGPCLTGPKINLTLEEADALREWLNRNLAGIRKNS